MKTRFSTTEMCSGSLKSHAGEFLGETSLLIAGCAAFLVSSYKVPVVPSSRPDNQKHSYISTVPLETVTLVGNLSVEWSGSSFCPPDPSCLVTRA